MKKGRSTGTLTKEEEKLHRAIRDLGCICCWMVGIGPVPCAIHHLTVGGKHGQKRRGHEFVLGLCDWHHQGYLPQDCSSVKEAEEWYGYSYALTPAKFRQSFGNGQVPIVAATAFNQLANVLAKYSSQRSAS